MGTNGDNRLTPKLHSASISLAVLLLGFGVMSMFWVLGSWSANLPGFYDFPSATFGDALVLPMLMFVLIRIGRWSSRRTIKHNFLLALAGFLGLSAGAYSQWAWLNDPAIKLNWTLPEIGHFNSAGWYHAIFLSLASATFAVAFTQAVIATRKYLSRHNENIPIEYSLTLILTPLFPGIHAIENLSPDASVAEFTLRIMPSLLIPIILFIISGIPQNAITIPILLTSLILTYAIPFLIVMGTRMDPQSWGSNVLITLWSANFVFSAWGHTSRNRFTALAALTMSATLLLGSLFFTNADSVVHPIWKQVALSAFVALLSLVIAQRVGFISCSRKILLTETTVNVLIFFFCVGFGLWATSIYGGLLLDSLIVIWSISVISAIQYLEYIFNKVVQAEDRNMKHEQKIQKIRFYYWTFTTAFVVVTTLVRAESDALSSALVDFHSSTLPLPSSAQRIHSLVVACVIVWLCWVVFQYFARKRLTPKRNSVLFLITGTLLVALSWIAILSPLIFSTNRLLTMLVYSIAMPPVVSVALMIFFSVKNNIFLLRGKNFDRVHMWEAVVLALCVSSLALLTIVLMLTGDLAITSLVLALILLLLATFSARLLVPSIRVAYNDDLERYWVKTGPRGALMQDAALIFIMFIFVAVYPGFSIVIHRDPIEGAVGTIAYLGVVASVYGWVLKNNIRHASKYDPRHPAYVRPDQGDMPMSIEVLHRLIRQHTKSQNLSSMLMLLVVIPYLLSSINVVDLYASPTQTDALPPE